MNATQLSLLPMEPSLPEGFTYRPDFLPLEEERDLVEQFRDLAFKEFDFHGFRGKRRVVSFGLHYDFTAGRLREAAEIPGFLLPLRDRAARFAGLQAEALRHALVIEYTPGAGIGWHRDRPAFDEVVGVSLLSACRFRLRRKTATGWERKALTIEPRSAYHLRGEVRSGWEHSIPAAESLRYSVTFRSLKAAGS